MNNENCSREEDNLVLEKNTDVKGTHVMFT